MDSSALAFRKFNIFNWPGFRDIRFWIILFFVIRLYGISLPPLETSQNWRQTTVCMAARNFYETDPDIFYPRLDIAGEKSGITGMEFPVFNYLIYLVSLLFGYDHWYGRLINLIVSSIGVYYFFLLVRKYFSSPTAFYSAFVLIFSLWFAYSRKIMPDTFSASLMIMGLFYGTNFLDRKSSAKNLVLYFLFSLIAILSKLPSGYALVIIAPFIFDRKIPIINKITISITTIVIIVPVYVYYFYWVPHLVEKFGFWHFFMGKGIVQGFYELIDQIDRTLVNFYEEALKYAGFIMFLWGLFIAIRRKECRILISLGLLFAAFAVIMLKAGWTFCNHAYYMIPFIPAMALVAGYGLSKIHQKSILYIFLVAIAVEGILNQKQDFYLHENNKALLNLESELDSISRPDDLVLINSGTYPTPMYFAHRKGWIDYNENIAKGDYIDDLRSKGLKYIVILKRTFGNDITLPYKIKFRNRDYTIYAVPDGP